MNNCGHEIHQGNWTIFFHVFMIPLWTGGFPLGVKWVSLLSLLVIDDIVSIVQEILWSSFWHQVMSWEVPAAPTTFCTFITDLAIKSYGIQVSQVALIRDFDLNLKALQANSLNNHCTELYIACFHFPFWFLISSHFKDFTFFWNVKLAMLFKAFEI